MGFEEMLLADLHVFISIEDDEAKFGAEGEASEHCSNATRSTLRVCFETSTLRIGCEGCRQRKQMELQKLDKEWSKGVVYIMGHSFMKASGTS